MTLRCATRSVIQQVEATTRRPVLVRSDTSLKVLATVTMARGVAPAHFVSYNPASAMAPDYPICHQCGFILRLFANPPSQRFDFAGSHEGRAEVHRTVAVQPEIRRRRLTPTAIGQYADHLFDGVMTQLRSVPIGLRVDAWVAEDYPELRRPECRP
jgi:hypothetical protein